MNKIKVTYIISDENDKEIVISGLEGDNLLDIAHDNKIELQHNCGGVCGCSTCHVYVEDGVDSTSEISDNEEDRIDLAENPKLNSRLACQCEIEAGTTDLKVRIPNQNFLGH